MRGSHDLGMTVQQGLGWSDTGGERRDLGESRVVEPTLAVTVVDQNVRGSDGSRLVRSFSG